MAGERSKYFSINAFRSWRRDWCLEKNIFVESEFLLNDSAEWISLKKKKQNILDLLKKPGEDRRPTLTWPRQIPVDGEPQAVIDEVIKNGEFHKDSNIPKLFINADPGSILTWKTKRVCKILE